MKLCLADLQDRLALWMGRFTRRMLVRRISDSKTRIRYDEKELAKIDREIEELERSLRARNGC